jgi:hypothetical protein
MRFVTVSTASTPFLPLRMSLPRRISRFETHLDHPQKWDFWTHRRRSAEKVPTMGKATPHPADRQACGYNPTHQRGAIACPWYQSLRNRVGYFGGTGKILGLGFGSFFFVFGCLFCVSVVRSRLFICTFWLHNLVFK